MAKKEKPKSSVRQKLSKAFDLPGEVIEGMPEMEFFGNKEVVVDHCRSVLEYNDKQVRILADKMALKFCGRSLRLNYMTQDSVMITGYITSLTFE